MIKLREINDIESQWIGQAKYAVVFDKCLFIIATFYYYHHAEQAAKLWNETNNGKYKVMEIINETCGN